MITQCGALSLHAQPYDASGLTVNHAINVHGVPSLSWIPRINLHPARRISMLTQYTKIRIAASLEGLQEIVSPEGNRRIRCKE